MITTLSTLKTRLKIEEFDTAEDTLLTSLIQHIGERFDQECNRKFARSEGAYFEFPADRDSFIPLRYPIESISAWHLKADETEGFVAQNTPTYVIGSPGESKCIVSLTYPLGTNFEIARITYTGGYVMPGGTVGTGQTALPPAIEDAALQQLTVWYRDKDKLGLASLSTQGGSVAAAALSVVKPLDLLPQVMNLLRRFERWVP